MLSSCLLNTHVYALDLGCSTLVREAWFCSRQWAMQRLRIGQSAENECVFDCSAINGTFISSLPALLSLKDHSGWKEHKSWKMGRGAVKFCAVNMLWPLHSQAQQWLCLSAQDPHKVKPAKIPACTGVRFTRPHPYSGAIDS